MRETLGLKGKGAPQNSGKVDIKEKEKCLAKLVKVTIAPPSAAWQRENRWGADMRRSQMPLLKGAQGLIVL